MTRRRLKELVFLLIGMSTPLGILAVNASAFVMRHLSEFRVTIAACALVSGLCLNGLGAYLLLGRAAARTPRIYHEYRAWTIALAVITVIAWSAFGAYGSYWSMQDPRRLPNLAAVLTAVWLLLFPFLAVAASRYRDFRQARRRRRTDRREPLPNS